MRTQDLWRYKEVLVFLLTPKTERVDCATSCQHFASYTQHATKAENRRGLRTEEVIQLFALPLDHATTQSTSKTWGTEEERQQRVYRSSSSPQPFLPSTGHYSVVNDIDGERTRDMLARALLQCGGDSERKTWRSDEILRKHSLVTFTWKERWTWPNNFLHPESELVAESTFAKPGAPRKPPGEVHRFFCDEMFMEYQNSDIS